MRTSPIRRLLVTGASIAVATVGLTALAPAANAASTSLKFNCEASILKDQEFVFDADIVVPTDAEAGKKITTSFTGSVTAPNSTRGAAYALLQGRFLEGIATIDGKFGGAPVTLEADLPRTAIPAASGAFSLPTTGGGSFVADAVGTQDLTITGFKAPLTMTKADGTTAPITVTCVAKEPATVVASVQVTKAVVVKPAKTKTTVKVKHSKKTKKATVRVKVTKAKKKSATGKAKVVIKKGKKTVGKRTVKLKSGSAKVVFKKIRAKGKYTVTVKYVGTKTQKKSSKKASFRVK